jgi:hypothetical protein
MHVTRISCGYTKFVAWTALKTAFSPKAVGFTAPLVMGTGHATGWQTSIPRKRPFASQVAVNVLVPPAVPSKEYPVAQE